MYTFYIYFLGSLPVINELYKKRGNKLHYFLLFGLIRGFLRNPIFPGVFLASFRRNQTDF